MNFNFKGIIQWLYAVGLGAASVAVTAVQDYVAGVEIDVGSIEGMLQFVFVGLLARGFGWLLAKIPKPLSP